MNIEICVYGNRGEHYFKFPAKWAVCPDCDGRATTSRHVECDGGGFTASEWAEQDEDFREDYMAGRFDQPCPTCKGRSTIQEIDEEAVTDRRLLKVLAEYRRQMRDHYDILAMEAAERRMGA